MSWPDGYSFTDIRTLTRGACAGELQVRVSPGAGNEIVLESFNTQNRDTTARNVQVELQDSSGAFLAYISRNASLAADVILAAPRPDTSRQDILDSPGPIIISGTQRVASRVVSVAALEDARFLLRVRCRYGDPTITEVNA